jgi:hypothetical protein
MKIKIISLSVLFVLLILSCKKEELTNVENSQVMFLSNLLVDDQSYFQYTYNDSNLVSEESSKFDFTINHYNDKNQLVSSDYYWNNTILNSNAKMIEATLSQGQMINSANGTKGGTFRYEYDNNNNLTKVTCTRPSSGSEYSVFSYNEDNRIDKQDIYWNNVLTGYIEYQYDGRGNLITEILYDVSATGVAESPATTRYIFDNKQNPYRSFKSLPIPGIYTNPNNITKELYMIHQDSGQGIDKILVKENTYEYNINGYPVSKNGNIKYIYK